MTIENIINISIKWIFLQDNIFAKCIAHLLPQVTLLDFTPEVLALDGLPFPESSPWGVCYMARDRHFGAK
jgi:hypothetical protein